MSASRRRWRSDVSGAAALEFAIALPVLVLALSGLAQFAWAQHCATSLRYAMTQTSRALQLNPTMTEATYVSLVKSKLGEADGNVTVNLAITTDNGRKVATATGAYTPTVVLIFGPTFPIHFTAKVITSLPSS